MEAKLLFTTLIIIASVAILSGCRPEEITDFEQCVAAGYPVMESYPRQCRTPDGKIFVETVPPIQPPSVKLNYDIGGCGEQESKEYVKIRGPVEARVDFKIVDGFVELTHHLNYVCCAVLKVYIDSIETLPEHTVIKILEKNEGEMCRCVCDYDVAARIGPLKEGKYLVQIYGVEFEKIPAELVWEKEIEVKLPEVSGLPNPASAYCIEHGGDLKIMKDEQGNEYGVCVFPDGSECEEWAFFRGECTPGRALDEGNGGGFCGWSTNGACSTDAECVPGGCSGQVCQSISEEPAITTCEFRQCYDASEYGLACKCVNGQCRWQ